MVEYKEDEEIMVASDEKAVEKEDLSVDEKISLLSVYLAGIFP